jgi:hypothetical protein
MKMKLPFVRGFGDYHDAWAFQDNLNDVSIGKVKYKEIAFDGLYWGVFFEGKLPPKDKLKKILLKAGWADNLEHSEFLGQNTHFA